ncbi:hypothetical protein CCP2SC5_920015 [Azospirillaceae bacterium]
MLLRNKTMECIVPKKNGKSSADPETTYISKDVYIPFKLVVFRMPENLKTDFKVALLKNHLDIQHTFEAFTEVFISWTAGEKIPDAMKAVVKRSATLMNGV